MGSNQNLEETDNQLQDLIDVDLDFFAPQKSDSHYEATVPTTDLILPRLDLGKDLICFNPDEIVESNQPLQKVQNGGETTRRVQRDDLIYTPVPVFDCAFCVRG